MFCSVHCRNSANGKKAGGHNRNRVAKTCEACGENFEVPECRKDTARACSRKCLGALHSSERAGRWHMGESNPGWKGGIQTYRQHRKDACERCGSTRFLVVHHKDENRYNNVLENLETLCKRCHQLHHDCVANLPN